MRGEGRFCDDLKIDGQLAGVFVRSMHAHARLPGVAVEDARRMPGVVAVLTAADLAGVDLSRRSPVVGRDGEALVVPHRPALADERVVHIGEPIALVVAETLAAARDAADLVAVDYEPLPSVSDAREALRPGAPVVWPEAPGNLALDWVWPDGESEAAVERAVAGAAHVVRVTAINQRLAGVPLETRGATAIFNATDNRYILHAPSQSAHVLKADLCAILGIESRQLQVLSGDVGGSFGLKTRSYPEHIALMAAAKLTGRPVHWMASRSEAFLSDQQGRDIAAEAVLALDREGRFLALKVSAVANLGAYLTGAGANIPTRSFASCFPEMYDIPHVSIATRLAFTNTLPTGPYRGAGRPEANYVMERVVDAAARQTGIDAIELRQRNLIPPEAMPYRSVVGNVYDSGDFAGALAKASELAATGSFAGRRRAATARARLRGIGISCFLEHAGAASTEGAVLAVESGRVVVRLGMQASGQGHQTVFGNMVAERLGVTPDRVAVEEGDSDLPIRGGPAVGSRSTVAAGTALVAGIEQLIATARGLAADLMQADAGNVVYRDGFLEVTGTNHRMSLFDLGERLARSGAVDKLKTVAQEDHVTTFPNGCHIAEVEIDPETGAVTVVGYVAVDDCGVVLDHTLAEGQIVGGIAQGLGQALLERVVYDEACQMLSASLTDYAMPRAADMPVITSAFHPVPCLTNPLGVKGIGEAGATAAIAAIMNAIADAIPGGRGQAIDMPATSQRVWRACVRAQQPGPAAEAVA